ncbi:MAG: orotidine 5'-phosphate decarboxylase [Candidatus Nitrosocaldus sp.]
MSDEERSNSKDNGSASASARSHIPTINYTHTSSPSQSKSIFLKRLSTSVDEHDGSRIVLALDLPDLPNRALIERAHSMIDALAGYICSIKINMHLLLPLSMDDLRLINDHAHSYGLQSIADIKLNDIPSTNKVAIEDLADYKFDALTINPIIGPDALRDAIHDAHGRGMGAIALVYMSHKGAENSYGMRIKIVYGEQQEDEVQLQMHKHHQYSSSSSSSYTSLYRVFLEWALASNADGIVVGATRPEIIRECRAYVDAHGYDTAIFSPGSGAQGGDPSVALSNGADYIIVGRSIIDADDPVREASRLARISLRV